MRAIVFSSDGNGALQLGIALYSLLTSAASPDKIRVYVLDSGIAGHDREKIAGLEHRFGCHIALVPMDGRLEGMPASRNFPPAACSRLLLPELLRKEDIVLYADIDVLFCRDVTSLLEMELGDDLAAAVYETRDYFNSGVMLLNLARMRQEGCQQACIDFLDRFGGKLLYFDQDALNAVLGGRVRPLHPQWNWNELQPRKLFKRYIYWGALTFVEALQVCLSASIRHFACRPKMTSHNYRWNRKLYNRVWAASPWSGVPPTGRLSWGVLWRQWYYACYDRWLMHKIKHVLRKNAQHNYPKVPAFRSDESSPGPGRDPEPR